MTERFTIKEIDNFSYGIKVTDVIMDNHIELPQSTACDLLNKLHKEVQAQSIVIKGYQERNDKLFKENKQLKMELQRIYDIATLNKAITIIENRYDKYLEDRDVECIPCKRKAYIECMELLDDFRDDLR